MVALPETCVFVEAPETDPANPSSLAAKAHELGIEGEQTLVVRGKYEHVGFIHHPDPLVTAANPLLKIPHFLVRYILAVHVQLV